jgi:hypothetical protein
MTMQAAELDAFQLAPVLQLVVNRSGQIPANGTWDTLFTSAMGGPCCSHSANTFIDSASPQAKTSTLPSEQLIA